MITLAKDKKLHIAAGAVTAYAGALGTQLILQHLGFYPVWAALGGVVAGSILVTLVAWGKELDDDKNPDKHTAEQLDAVATMGGGLAAITIFSSLVLLADLGLFR